MAALIAHAVVRDDERVIQVDTGWPAEIVEIELNPEYDDARWDVTVLAWAPDHGLAREDYVGRIETPFVPMVVAAVVAHRVAQADELERVLSQGNPDA